MNRNQLALFRYYGNLPDRLLIGRIGTGLLACRIGNRLLHLCKINSSFLGSVAYVGGYGKGVLSVLFH